ncbi:MAG: hypothetical protein V7K61_22600 [Nostoc sp.]
MLSSHKTPIPQSGFSGLKQNFRLSAPSDKGRFSKPYMLIGIGFVIADIVVKAVLAPIWQKLLLSALG